MLRDTDVDDLIDLRLHWKPATSPAESAAFAAVLRDWWGSEGEARVGWLARHTDGSSVGMANAASASYRAVGVVITAPTAR